MNLDKLNNWLTLGANLGVLVGIIFLIVEVQQNNLIARAQTRMDIAGSMRENILMFSSPEGISIQAKLTRGEDLSLEEQIWIRLSFRNEIKAWENVAYQYSLGFYDQEEIDTYRQTWMDRAQRCREPFGEQFFEAFQSFSNQIRPSFRAELQGYFSENGCFN